MYSTNRETGLERRMWSGQKDGGEQVTVVGNNQIGEDAR